MDARRIGREVGVRYVLDGSVLLDKDLARVNAELIDTLTDGQLWSGRFDKERSDALAAQDEIVARLSRSVGLQVIDAQAKHSIKSKSAEAIDFVMRGWAVMNRPSTKDTLIQARALFEQALLWRRSRPSALAGRHEEAQVALNECRRLRPGSTIAGLSRIWSVPLDATDPRYRDCHDRLNLGLESAGTPR
jgi:TolB-like protein